MIGQKIKSIINWMALMQYEQVFDPEFYIKFLIDDNNNIEFN